MNSELTYGKGISRLLPAGFLVLVGFAGVLLPGLTFDLAAGLAVVAFFTGFFCA